MFRNFWKVALRSLLKRKGFTLINVLGLATGMAVCVLILLFFREEKGYDRFEVNGDRVYRMALDRKYPNRVVSYAVIPLSIGSAVEKEFPEVESATCLQPFAVNVDFIARVGDKHDDVREVYLADSNFFHVFPMELLAGDTGVLRKPDM